MRDLENNPPQNNAGQGNSTPSLPTQKVALKKQAVELYAHNTRKNDLELLMRQLQARGLENTEEYKKCDDELFAILRQSVFRATPAPMSRSVDRVQASSSSASLSSGFTPNRMDDAEDELDFQYEDEDEEDGGEQFLTGRV